MNRFATVEEIAREARAALNQCKDKPGERFDRLVRIGWINRQGEVTRLLGGDAEPEPDSEPGVKARAENKKPRQRR